MTVDLNSYRDLQVYQVAFQLQQSLFRASRIWPREESYSLTDQVRRSSRSIGANIAESWAKRRYPAHFLSKLSDADGELQETYHWLATASSCGYLDSAVEKQLEDCCQDIGRMLGTMMAKHEKFCIH